jgi:cation-transporting ATPase E
MTTPTETTPITGLSSAEVQQRTAQGQVNQAPAFATRTYGQIIRENIFTFINTCLFGLGLALLLLGRPFDALLSAGVVLINAIASSAQELQAKRKLDEIALLNRPSAVVVRDGQEQTIAPDTVVLGDVLKASAGDQLLVDGSMVGAGRMEVDESQLTGESDLIVKQAGDPVFSGSYCVSGGGYYVAEKIGSESLVNQITAGARTFKRVLTPLQRDINVLVRVFLLIAIFLEFLLILNSLLSLRDLTESVQDATIVAGLIPNGLFLTISVAYAISAVRIIRFGVLVQQSNAVESLSNVDTLCVDKTGTLTANRLQMHAVYPLSGSEAEFQAILGEMVASASTGNKTSDALSTAYPQPARPLLAEVPFSSARKWSAVAFDTAARRGIYALGAPEMLRPYLGRGIDPTTPTGQALATQAAAWADEGLRVLLVAYHPDPTHLRDEGDSSVLPDDMQPLGLISLSDELRPEARETLAAFLAAGVQPKIISGDNPQTVAALARQAGLPRDIQLVSGTELAEMSEAEIADAARHATIFGRITPQQKEMLVKLLRQHRHYVAMVGDGVNDVLSLKQANLGIAMQSGSQATRNAADIVLTGDSFAALVPAVQEGQRIINGTRDVLRLFLTRVATLALLVIASLMVSSEVFPLTLTQSALIAFLVAGIPTPLIALWARPGPTGGSIVGQLLRFMLPAMLLSTMFALLVFYGGLLIGTFLVAFGNPDFTDEQIMVQAVAIARTALTTFLVLEGLLLVVFVEPPTRWWVGGDSFSGDWKPTLVALLCLGIYVVIMVVPAFREASTLTPLHPVLIGLILVCTMVWLFLLRWVWRGNLLERFLDVEFGYRYEPEARHAAAAPTAEAATPAR